MLELIRQHLTGNYFAMIDEIYMKILVESNSDDAQEGIRNLTYRQSEKKIAFTLLIPEKARRGNVPQDSHKTYLVEQYKACFTKVIQRLKKSHGTEIDSYAFMDDFKKVEDEFLAMAFAEKSTPISTFANWVSAAVKEQRVEFAPIEQAIVGISISDADVRCYKKWVKQVITKILAPMGFVNKSSTWNRHTKTIRQTVKFEIKDQSHAAVTHSYSFLGKPTPAMDETINANSFTKHWPLPEKRMSETQFSSLISQHVNNDVAPFFTHYDESASFLAAYEVGKIELRYFGLEDGWAYYHLGLAYMDAGDRQRAKECFQTVVNKYSDWAVFAWLRTRKNAAEKWIAQLNET